MTSFLRVIGFALQDIVRNASLSFMTVLMLILMLLSVNTILALRTVTDRAVAIVKGQIDLSVFFDSAAGEKQIADVRAHLLSSPDITDVVLVSRDEALADFRRIHADNPEVLASLSELGGNPFGVTLVVKAREPAAYERVMKALAVPEYEKIIEAKTFADTEAAINRIHAITTRVEQASWALTALFAVIAFIIVFNTIRVSIMFQRMEIGIKKLVGASNWFVRGPYLAASFIFSIFAVAGSTAILFVATSFFDPYLAGIFETQAFLTSEVSAHILPLAALEFIGALFLTVATSLVAMRKYLRV